VSVGALIGFVLGFEAATLLYADDAKKKQVKTVAPVRPAPPDPGALTPPPPPPPRTFPHPTLSIRLRSQITGTSVVVIGALLYGSFKN
jgi:hypothetical protein